MADLKGHALAVLEAFNSNDLDGYMRLVGDAEYHELATHRSLSGDALREALAGWRAAFSDATGTVTNSIESAGQVVQEITWNGTHDGPLVTPEGEIPASGARQTTPAIIVNVYEGDELKEMRHYFDLMTLMSQIGAA